MRRLTLLALSLLLVGCASTAEDGWSGLRSPFLKPVTTISYPIGEFSLVYADIKAAYGLLAAQLVAVCGQQLFTPATCAELDKARVRLETIDSAARNSIRNPGTSVDWQAIGEAIRMITSLAVSLGVPGGGAITKIPEILGGAGGVIERLRPQSTVPPSPRSRGPWEGILETSAELHGR